MLQVEELVFLGCHALSANRHILLLSLLYLVQSIRCVAEDVEIGRLTLSVRYNVIFMFLGEYFTQRLMSVFFNDSIFLSNFSWTDLFSSKESLIGHALFLSCFH